MLCFSRIVIAHEPMQNISFNVLVCTMYLMECVCTRAYFENKWHWIQLRVHIFSHAYQSMILLIENWLLPTIQTHSKARVVIGIAKWTRRMVPTMIWNSHGVIKICYNWNFLTTFFRETEKFWVNNCPISIKFGAFLVWSVLI